VSVAAGWNQDFMWHILHFADLLKGNLWNPIKQIRIMIGESLIWLEFKYLFFIFSGQMKKKKIQIPFHFCRLMTGKIKHISFLIV
jgi:hypothetical protein